MFNSLAYCCYTTSGNINFWFLDYFGFVKMTSKRDDKINVTNERFFADFCYHDIGLNDNARDASSVYAMYLFILFKHPRQRRKPLTCR